MGFRLSREQLFRPNKTLPGVSRDQSVARGGPTRAMKMDLVFVPVAIAKRIAAIEPRARRLCWPRALLLDSNLDDYDRRDHGAGFFLPLPPRRNGGLEADRARKQRGSPACQRRGSSGERTGVSWVGNGSRRHGNARPATITAQLVAN